MTEVDRRFWLGTDRPGEQVAVGSPLPGVRLMSARHSDRAWAEYHSEFDVCLVHAAQPGVGAQYRCRGLHSAGAGELMVFEPGDHHVTTRVYGRAAFSVLGVAPEKLRHFAEEHGLRGKLHFKSAHLGQTELTGSIERFVETAAREGCPLELECSFVDFAARLLESCAESPLALRRPDPVCHYGVRAARDFLRENYTQTPKLDELAKLAGLTRFAFAHAFKRYIGLAPHAYLKLRRVSEARRLIEHGLPISEIAGRLGYVDVPFLTRTLRSQFGAPPARWRRCYQSNLPLPRVPAAVGS